MTTAQLKSLQNSFHEVTDTKGGYKGIPIYAAPNLHEKCFEEFLTFSLPKDAPILILWAGGWAFDQRLVDNGYTNITAVEFIPEAYKAKGTTLISHDLNQDFFDLGKFDCIIAMEIIEHLENPSHFLRNIKSCLSGKWVILLSTPNVENFYSRFHFFFLNSLDYFGTTELQGTGHISPIFHHIFSFFVQNSGLRIVKRTYNQSAIHRWALLPNIVAIIAFTLSFLFRRDVSSGWVNIYILSHKGEFSFSENHVV